MSRKINVLSLFDGMSCGQIALERAGIKVDKYFASEIDKYAMQVTMKNYPNTKQVGDIVELKGKKLPKIDLLIGGSPCQGFSFAGKQLNFQDERSRLFFEFVRLLKETKPKYFLLENVKMKKEYQDVITEYLGVEPILINSALVSAQNRERLYWTNIPNVTQPEDKGILLGDILENIERRFIDKSKIKQYWKTNNYYQYDLSGKGHKSQDQRAYFTDKKHGTIPSHGASSKVKVFDKEGNISYLTSIECERLQTVPDNYTNCVSDSKRMSILGNGWTVDVIAHIFSFIDFNNI